MVSLRRNTAHSNFASLYCDFKRYDSSTGNFTEHRVSVWDKYIREYGLASVCKGTDLVLFFMIAFMSIPANQFQLFFSFFPVNKIPSKVSNGSWNCTVDHYSTFQHHLACNHQTECEDGRDESDHCPYSSTDCEGMIALCGRCYQFIHLHNNMYYETDTNNSYQWANNYCHSIGGLLSLPKCVFDWYGTLVRITGRHQNMFRETWLGLYTGDLSLPSMYRVAIVSEDKTVLFHSAEASDGIYDDEVKLCLYADRMSKMLYFSSCYPEYYFGVLCEFRTNQASEKFDYSTPISLASTNISLHLDEDIIRACRDGHVTYTFLMCDVKQYVVCGLKQTPCVFSASISAWTRTDSGDQVTEMPTFTCRDQLMELATTLLCDFLADCHDKTDESFCTHPRCDDEFTCTNGQCVSYANMCDRIKHCWDDSDETSCGRAKRVTVPRPFFPSPALITFDGVVSFTSVPMTSNDSCPVSHYRCPGDFNDCLPVYTRCNGMYDCIEHHDEDNCTQMKCPGFFRCRLSTMCVHMDHVCDGWLHCPQYDDELSCNAMCPEHCLCQGHSFLCHDPFPASLFPGLRSLDASGSGMTLSDVNNNTYLSHLVLARCSLTVVPDLQMWNLKYLDLSENSLCNISLTSFVGATALQMLYLVNNPLSSLHADPSSTDPHYALRVMDLSHTSLTVFDSELFSLFPHIYRLILMHTSIHSISSYGFRFIPHVAELYMEGSPVKTFPSDVFKDLTNLKHVSSENYKLCCQAIFPETLKEASCSAPKDEVSSCKDLLQSWVYRGVLWMVACLSMLGNTFCFCARIMIKSMNSSSGFSVFVTNLNIADFLMGVYIVLVAKADEEFRGRYLFYDDLWKHSTGCQVAGFLCLLSSEASALIIWLITLDRFVVIHFPFSTVRFGHLSAAVVCLFAWLISGLMALVPLLPVTAHWDFYSQTGICIPLPVTRREFGGRAYSFSIMIVLNCFLLVCISAGQVFIYRSVQSNTLKSTTTKQSRDKTIAQRLISVALSDFLCWFPIGLCGLLALASVPVPGEVNVALAVVVLPLNSAINPFLYTANTLLEKRRKVNEQKMLDWMQAHADLFCS